MSLEQRIAQLEAEMSGAADGPSLAERLRDALDEARERQRLGRSRPEPPEGEDPMGQRLRRGWERALRLRAQLASGMPGLWS
jgi:hypothetical protein